MIKKIVDVSSGTLVQHCYEIIQSEIIRGVLKPGEKLKVEHLKHRLGVGQSPLREALSRLVESGLVSCIDNRGFWVAVVSEADIRDVYAIFTLLENMALGLAIDYGDHVWEANIVGQLHQLSLLKNKKYYLGNDNWIEQNYAFHKALIAACNSPMLLEIRNRLYLKFDRYCRIAYQIAQENFFDTYQEHKKIARAVLDRNKILAQELMTYHINAPLEHVMRELKNNNCIER